MPETCKTCRWWENMRDGYGTCDCPKMHHRALSPEGIGYAFALRRSLVFKRYSRMYVGPTLTGPDFGCIHHEPKEASE